MDRYEFMSPKWIEMAREVISGALSGRDLTRIRFSLSEEYTDPPAHLLKPGIATIGFTVRLDNGSVAILDDPDATADLRIVSAYEDALPVARDPDMAAADPEEIRARMAAGRLQVFGDPVKVPQLLGELDIHRLLAPHTA